MAMAARADPAPDPSPSSGKHRALLARIARYDECSPEWHLDYGRDAITAAHSKRAAVLVALVSRGGSSRGCDNDATSQAGDEVGDHDHCADYDVLLTLRSAHLRRNGGEVSLPGGRIEATDRDAEDAALREAEEEVGLRRADVCVVGRLPPLLTLDGIVVSPVVALLRDGFTVTPNPSEVSAIFYLPLKRLSCYVSSFLSQQGHRSFRMPRGVFVLHYFDDQVDGRMYTTWGLTAHFMLLVAAIAFDRRPEYNLSVPSCAYLAHLRTYFAICRTSSL